MVASVVCFNESKGNLTLTFITTFLDLWIDIGASFENLYCLLKLSCARIVDCIITWIHLKFTAKLYESFLSNILVQITQFLIDGSFYSGEISKSRSNPLKERGREKKQWRQSFKAALIKFRKSNWQIDHQRRDKTQIDGIRQAGAKLARENPFASGAHEPKARVFWQVRVIYDG